MFQVMDGDLALGRLAPDSMEMGKVGDIAAWAKVRGNREGPCAEPAATAGVDHQVGLFSAPVFDACEGVVGEQEPVVFSVQLGPGFQVAHAGFKGPLLKDLVESGPGHVVSVLRVVCRQCLKAESQPDLGPWVECDPGFADPDLSNPLLDAQTSEDGDHSRHQRLADQEWGTVVLVQNNNVAAHPG